MNEQLEFLSKMFLEYMLAEFHTIVPEHYSSFSAKALSQLQHS